MVNGIIFSVKRYSIHDGPGIRVTFFLKGCPLQCRWCHNPEGISPEPQVVTTVNRVGEKEFRKKETAGREWSVGEILQIAAKERVFIDQSGGGITFSGGEPLLQHEFLSEVLKACRAEGYHTAVDTSGFAQEEIINKIIPLTDMFLFDLKHLDPHSHKLYTGVSNKNILHNLDLLLNSGKDIMIRIPVVPGMNDDAGHLAGLVAFLAQRKMQNLKMISLLPYHKTGAAKYRKFNREYLMEGIDQPSGERMREIKKLFAETGIRVKIGG